MGNHTKGVNIYLQIYFLQSNEPLSILHIYGVIWIYIYDVNHLQLFLMKSVCDILF